MTDETALQPVLEALSLPNAAALKAAIKAGSVSLSDISRAILPGSRAALPDEIKPAPLPVELTEDQKRAIRKIPKVFGNVVPDEVRSLQDFEVFDLYEERQTLDVVEKLAAKRKKDIRTTILNHIDSEWDLAHAGEEVDRDKENHVLIETHVPVPDTDQEFSWEIRTGQDTLNPEALLELVQAGELDRKVYNAVTEQVRVVRDDKLMQEIAKNPNLLTVLGKVMTPGGKGGSMNIRKR